VHKTKLLFSAGVCTRPHLCSVLSCVQDHTSVRRATRELLVCCRLWLHRFALAQRVLHVVSTCSTCFVLNTEHFPCQSPRKNRIHSSLFLPVLIARCGHPVCCLLMYRIALYSARFMLLFTLSGVRLRRL